MNSFKIAYRSVRQRWFASCLTIFSMALGVMLVVAVLSIHGVVTRQFRNNASLGYNLLVGATKGGRLQLTLNSVYYLSQPVENISYRYFLEFSDEQRRQRDFANSSEERSAALAWEVMQSHSLLGGAVPGIAAGAAAVTSSLDQVATRHRDAGRQGKYSFVTQFAIPLCLGDYLEQYRVIGTIPEFFDSLVFDPETGAGFEFAEGRALEYWNDQHGFYEAVVGARVARDLGIELGHRFSPAHGVPGGHKHARDFVVVGILAPSGTPNDRAVFVNMEGFFLMEGHAKPLLDSNDIFAAPAATPSDSLTEAADADAAPEEESSGEEAESRDERDAHFAERQPLSLEEREVTAVLVRTANPMFGMRITDSVNEGKEAQCAQPIREITKLLDLFVRPMQWVLLGLTLLICLVSGISMLVSIYNSMSERRHEIAVIRALGARRRRVMAIVLLESGILTLAGGALGWVMGHGINAAVSSPVEARTGVRLGFLDMAPPVDLAATAEEFGLPGAWFEMFPKFSPELWIIPMLLLLAVGFGFIPALTAYRTDVSKNLGK